MVHTDRRAARRRRSARRRPGDRRRGHRGVHRRRVRGAARGTPADRAGSRRRGGGVTDPPVSVDRVAAFGWTKGAARPLEPAVARAVRAAASCGR
ncbi:hypothetical protein MICRO8M_50141 [Microbacterium sp. 8M]|nr:hypothetical protein MICRO8M_50141 [Microbacterium sp. 8M]